MIVLETERLQLAHFTVDDAEFILRLLNEPSFIQNIADKGVRSSDDARAYIQSGPIASYDKFGFGLNKVELSDSGVPIGMCGLIKRDALEDVDVGYAFLPEYWSKGYAREAASAVVAHGRRAFGLKRIVAITSQDNAASIRLLEKIGFEFEGLVRLHPDEPELKLFASNS